MPPAPLSVRSTISHLLPKEPVADASHAEALLEIAALMTLADGRLADEELVAYGQIVLAVRGDALRDDERAALKQRLDSLGDAGGARDRVREVAASLPAQLRELAFELAIAVALADRDASPLEDEMLGVLFEALGLEADRAERVADRVRRAFGALS